jgi:hypothetical protein
MRDEPLTVTTASGNGEGVTILALKGPLTLQNSFRLSAGAIAAQARCAHH